VQAAHTPAFSQVLTPRKPWSVPDVRGQTNSFAFVCALLGLRDTVKVLMNLQGQGLVTISLYFQLLHWFPSLLVFLVPEIKPHL
jgi:hypothetical protein